MKKTIFKSVLLACLLIFSACSEDEKPPKVTKPVEQEVVISVTPTDVEIDYQEQQIEIEVSGGEVTTEVDATSWINAQKKAKGFTITVQANKTGQKRIGVVYFVHNGRKMARTLITQSSSLVLPVPIFDFGKTAKDIKETENKKNTLTFVREDTQGEGSMLIYKINNHPYLTDLYYIVTLDGYSRSKVSLNKESAEAKSIVETYFLQEGFEKVIRKGYKNTLSTILEDKEMFFNKKQQVLAEYYEDAKDPHFAFKYEPTQQKPYTSFVKIPEIVKGIELANIQAEETNKRSQLVNDPNVTTDYKDKKGKNRRKELYKVSSGGDLLYRQHFFLENDTSKKYLLTQTSFYYTNFNLAFFAGLDGKFYLTEEFQLLMEQNGFKPIRSLTSIGVKYGFTKAEGNNKINIMVQRRKPAEGFDPLLEIKVY